MIFVKRAGQAMRIAAAVLVIAGQATAQDVASRAAAEAHLLARPTASQRRADAADSVGLLTLNIESGRGALLYIPASYRADRPTPLVLMLHGAGGNPRGGLRPFMSLADSAGVILLAPQSLGQTWDFVRGSYGPDVAFIDHALAHVFAHYAVDAARLAVSGFSDGASYALSLGVTNGDLFTHVIAFSPGFMVPVQQRGTPRLFVSHGTKDLILLIDRCSRRIVQQLQDAGYDVRYQEFDGGHTVPAAIAHDALAWLTGAGSG